MYLNSHFDRYFTFSAGTIRTKEAYTPDQKIVAYFAFPLLGIAVPLWAGDDFFLTHKNHTVSHLVVTTGMIFITCQCTSSQIILV